MSPSPYTPQQKAEALKLYEQHGPAEAARRTGIAKSTIASWGRRSGTRTNATANTSAAVAHAALTVQQRKLNLADDLLDTANRVLAQMFEPTTERKIVTIAGGLQHEGKWSVATVDRPKPTYPEQARIATTVAILVDKVQILTGGATQRIGTEGGDAQVKDAAAAVLQLVQKPGRREEAS